jgi:hypothetical protein
MSEGSGGNADWAVPGSSTPPPGWSAEQPPPSPPPPDWSQSGWGQPGWTPGYAPPAAPKPGIIPLRPLGIGELLDGAFTAIRRYQRATLGLSAAVAAVQQGLSLAVDVGTDDVSSPLGSGLGTLGTVSGILVFVVNAVLSATLLGMLSLVFGEAVLGRDISIREIWSRLRPMLWRLLAAAFLATVLPILGLVGLIIGGIVLWVALSFTTPALVLERLRIGEALRRSWRLAMPAFWRVLGIRLLGMLIASVISTILALPGIIVALVAVSDSSDDAGSVNFGLGAEIAIRLSSLLANTVSAPFLAGVIVLLYLDRRIRAEALDVTLAKSAAGAGTE